MNWEYVNGNETVICTFMCERGVYSMRHGNIVHLSSDPLELRSISEKYLAPMEVHCTILRESMIDYSIF